VELPRQVLRIELLVVQLVDEGPGAVRPLLAHRLGDQLEAVRFRHQVGVERAGHVGDVDHLGAHRVADLERRHRARPADVVDLDLALAGLVDAVDKALEVLRELGLLGEGRHRAQRHLLGLDHARGQHQQCTEYRGGFHGRPSVPISFRIEPGAMLVEGLSPCQAARPCRAAAFGPAGV
jgi:hypothetical protein